MVAATPERPRAASGSEHGFTLIELLVSLAILAFTATLLMEGVLSAAALTRRTRDHEAAGAAVAAAQIILRDRIEHIVPLNRSSAGDPVADIDGTDHMLEFTGASPPGAALDAVQRYRLRLAIPGDLVLYRTSTRNDRIDQAAPSVAGWNAATLLTGVTSLSLAYYGGMASDPRPQWRAAWRQQPGAPRLVRLRIGFRDGDPRTWPELVVHPGTTLDLACDPDSAQGCKAGA